MRDKLARFLHTMLSRRACGRIPEFYDRGNSSGSSSRRRHRRGRDVLIARGGSFELSRLYAGRMARRVSKKSGTKPEVEKNGDTRRNNLLSGCRPIEQTDERQRVDLSPPLRFYSRRQHRFRTLPARCQHVPGAAAVTSVPWRVYICQMRYEIILNASQ